MRTTDSDASAPAFTPQREHAESLLDDALGETFSASDPVSVYVPPVHRRSRAGLSRRERVSTTRLSFDSPTTSGPARYATCATPRIAATIAPALAKHVSREAVIAANELRRAA